MISKTYKNGATLIYRYSRRKHTSVTAGFFFGRNRDNYPDPTAHFCEHMFFKETKNLTGQQVSAKINKTLSSRNGRTGIKFTCIDFCRSNRIIEPCFDLSSELLLNTKFSKKHIESEKGVIKQELTRALNDPNIKLSCAIAQTFRDYYCSDTTVLGTPEEIDKMDAETLKKFQKECFIAQNFFICIRGGISYFKAKRLAEKYFIKKLNSNPEYPVDKSLTLENNRPGNLNVAQFPLNKTWCSISIMIPSEYENVKTLATIGLLRKISNSATGLIGLALRKKGLIYTSNIVSGVIAPNQSCLTLDFECASENVNKIIDILGEKLESFANGEISQDLIEEKKLNRKYENDESIQDSIYPNKDYLKYFRGRKVELTNKFLKQYNKAFKKLTTEDIQVFLKNILSKPENFYVTILSNKDASNFYTYKEIQKKLSIK